MSKAPAFTATGTKKEAVALPKEVFGLEANHDLLKLSYNASLADERNAHAKTLRRGEVRGGGKKPWRQKGTGRARVGSRRNPVWRGGGVAFGPLGIENYSLEMTKKMKRLAIAQALSAQAADNGIIVVEAFDVKDGKAKTARSLLDKVASGRILLVVENKSELIDRATSNLADVDVVNATYLSARNVLDADQIVITKKALDSVVAWLTGKEVKAEPKAKTKTKAAEEVE